tara:strand:- start:3072 stop:3320 length:249 start_codon:yes stop_codon:yes gene_type:complete
MAYANTGGITGSSAASWPEEHMILDIYPAGTAPMVKKVLKSILRILLMPSSFLFCPAPHYLFYTSILLKNQALLPNFNVSVY